MTYNEFLQLKVNDIVHRRIDENEIVYAFKITVVDAHGTRGQFYDPVMKDWSVAPPDYFGSRDYITLHAPDVIKKLDIPNKMTDAFIEEKWRELAEADICDLQKNNSPLTATWFLFPEGTFSFLVTDWFNEHHSKGLQYLRDLISKPEEKEEALIGDVEDRANPLALDVEDEDEGFSIDTGEDMEEIPIIPNIPNPAVPKESSPVPAKKENASESVPAEEPKIEKNGESFEAESSEEAQPQDTKTNAFGNTQRKEQPLQDPVHFSSEIKDSVVSDSIWKEHPHTTTESIWISKEASSKSSKAQDDEELPSFKADTAKAASDLDASDTADDQETASTSSKEIAETASDEADASDSSEMIPEAASDTADVSDSSEVIPEAADTLDSSEMIPETASDTADVSDSSDVIPEDVSDTEEATGSEDESKDTLPSQEEELADFNSESMSQAEPTVVLPSVKCEPVPTTTAEDNPPMEEASAKDTPVLSQTAEAADEDTAVDAVPEEPVQTKNQIQEDMNMNNQAVDFDAMKQAAAAIRDEYLRIADQIANLSADQFEAIQKHLSSQGISNINDGLANFVKSHQNLLSSIYEEGFEIADDNGNPVTLTPAMLAQIREKMDIQAGKDIALSTDAQELSDEGYLELYRSSVLQ